MSDDEMMATFACLAATAISWPRWLWKVNGAVKSSIAARVPVLLAPAAGMLVLLVILLRLASHDVRNDPTYLFFYMLMGAAWVGVGVTMLPLAGICVRDDVTDRGNWAVSFLAAGAIIGLTLSFAGANIGDGPGWWVVVFSALLSGFTLADLWYVLARVTPLMDAVTIDRDVAAGLRGGAFLVGAGLLLGSAVAGNWVSAGDTVRDFVLASWPILPLLGLAVFIEFIFRPAPHQRSSIVLHGLLPACFYVAMSLLAVILFNAWAKSTGAW